MRSKSKIKLLLYLSKIFITKPGKNDKDGKEWTAGANKGDISVVKSEVDKSRPVIATYTPFGNKNLTNYKR